MVCRSKVFNEGSEHGTAGIYFVCGGQWFGPWQPICLPTDLFQVWPKIQKKKKNDSFISFWLMSIRKWIKFLWSNTFLLIGQRILLSGRGQDVLRPIKHSPTSRKTPEHPETSMEIISIQHTVGDTRTETWPCRWKT